MAQASTPLEPRLSQHKRVRGLSQFWASYRASTQGMVGLVMLVICVVAAVFAPLFTPYIPDEDYLAQPMAGPAWLRLFPSFRAEPVTVNTTIGPEWEIVSSTGIRVSQHHGTGSEPTWITLSPENTPLSPNTSGSVTLEHNLDYFYTPPQTFEFLFSWAAQLEGVDRATLNLTLVKPGGKTYDLWGKALHTTDDSWKRERIDARQLMLKRRLKLDWHADSAKEVFSEQGRYRLVLTGEFTGIHPQTSFSVRVTTIKTRVLGTLHGVLGADHMGRDLWTQLLYGARISLIIGIVAALIAVVIGTSVGIASGYIGGVVDEVLMRFTDIMLSIPSLPILIILAGLVGKSVWNIVLLVGIFSWMGTARLVRSQTLSLKERSFVEVARACGGGDIYIMFSHILPNVIPLIFASLVLRIPSAILAEASLSFLGFGDPVVPTWGRMLHNARSFGAFTELAWWWIVPPGLAITFLSLTFVFIGNTIDTILNPKHRERS